MTGKPINCPHCQHDQPAEHSAAKCFFCQQPLPAPPSPNRESALKHSPARAFPARWFFLSLLGPAVVTMLSAHVSGTINDSMSSVIGFSGGVIGGIFCGVLLGLRVRAALPARIVLCLFFSVIMVVVCLMLCCFGCTLVDPHYRLN